ncbi:hypothetical protein HUS70_20000 [Pandoraea nosoerga]|uniref:hypothetical protein n=1 Tax=Pandoraea nosoerga TaxID=2508296 RepID=UPI00197F5195|nr:hypothetical protein [Pandoraea nosoerga]MBN4667815.1 hypothetical protein [Pandoraea nosoerga]MBN4677705.1 hypothetical protein [Pandoraea nosoerga]MBN4682684.1 hypothetical protein [Pandoraea nosoerga]MBN4746883.1 hypothetical protein [Pandoraea nosoerga]
MVAASWTENPSRLKGRGGFFIGASRFPILAIGRCLRTSKFLFWNFVIGLLGFLGKYQCFKELFCCESSKFNCFSGFELSIKNQ